jgi:hypothetical protein
MTPLAARELATGARQTAHPVRIDGLGLLPVRRQGKLIGNALE